jgi:predicted permease
MTQSLVLLLVCFGLGVLVRRLVGATPGPAPALNAWLLQVALPALVLRAVHGMAAVDPRLLLVALGPWLCFLGAMGLGLWAARRGWLERGSAGALVLTAGLGNTAFVGLPLVEGLAGREGLPVAVVADQLGTFLVLPLVALPFAMRLAAQSPSPVQLLRRVVLFPPFLALVAALLLRPVPFPSWLDGTLQRLGDTLSPLALFAVGWQLRLSALGGRVHLVALALGYKLLVAPLLALPVLLLLGAGGLPLRVAVVQAAMPPMVTAGIVAAEYRLDPDLAALMVGVGVPLGFLTVPAVWALLG